TLEDIFGVTVDKTLDVENLKTEIKSTRPNLFQKDFDLYKVVFFQPNRSLISSVNSRNDKVKTVPFTSSYSLKRDNQ
ncbi:4713_t:CDS:2, partial [Dentiscutata heterogama]